MGIKGFKDRAEFDKHKRDEVETLEAELKVEREKSKLLEAKVAVLIEKIIPVLTSHGCSSEWAGDSGGACLDFTDRTDTCCACELQESLDSLAPSAQALLDELKNEVVQLKSLCVSITNLAIKENRELGKELERKDNAIERHKGVLRDIKFVTTQKQVDEIATKALKGKK